MRINAFPILFRIICALEHSYKCTQATSSLFRFLLFSLLWLIELIKCVLWCWLLLMMMAMVSHIISLRSVLDQNRWNERKSRWKKTRARTHTHKSNHIFSKLNRSFDLATFFVRTRCGRFSPRWFPVNNFFSLFPTVDCYLVSNIEAYFRISAEKEYKPREKSQIKVISLEIKNIPTLNKVKKVTCRKWDLWKETKEMLCECEQKKNTRTHKNIKFRFGNGNQLLKIFWCYTRLSIKWKFLTCNLRIQRKDHVRFRQQFLHSKPFKTFNFCFILIFHIFLSHSLSLSRRLSLPF